MLFKPLGTSRLQRLQGAYVSEEEIALVVEQCRHQREQDLDESMLEVPGARSSGGRRRTTTSIPTRTPCSSAPSTSSCRRRPHRSRLLQRRLRVGYTRAGRLIDMLERRGIISGYEGSKPRRVLVGEGELVASPARRIDQLARCRGSGREAVAGRAYDRGATPSLVAVAGATNPQAYSDPVDTESSGRRVLPLHSAGDGGRGRLPACVGAVTAVPASAPLRSPHGRRPLDPSGASRAERPRTRLRLRGGACGGFRFRRTRARGLLLDGRPDSRRGRRSGAAAILGLVAMPWPGSARRHSQISLGRIGGTGVARAGWILGLLASLLGRDGGVGGRLFRLPPPVRLIGRRTTIRP